MVADSEEAAANPIVTGYSSNPGIALVNACWRWTRPSQAYGGQPLNEDQQMTTMATATIRANSQQAPSECNELHAAFASEVAI